jgi:hypothetical protein
MNSTDVFQGDRCHIECGIDSGAPEANIAPLIIRHCPDSEGIAVFGNVTRFRERRGGLLVDVQRWIEPQHSVPPVALPVSNGVSSRAVTLGLIGL